MLFFAIGYSAHQSRASLKIEATSGPVQRVRNMAKNYHPFGTYHFIVGAQIRTPSPQKPLSRPASKAPFCCLCVVADGSCPS